MEHKKSLFEPFQEIKDILKAQGGEFVTWCGKQLFNPSPITLVKGGWTLIAAFLIWQGVQKVVAHGHILKKY